MKCLVKCSVETSRCDGMFGEMLCANSEMFVKHFEVKVEKYPGRLLNKFPTKVKRLDFSI